MRVQRRAKHTRRRIRRRRLTRDGLTFVLGAGIILQQWLIRDAVQPELVTAGVALMLAPLAYRANDAANRRQGEDR